MMAQISTYTLMQGSKSSNEACRKLSAAAWFADDEAALLDCLHQRGLLSDNELKKVQLLSGSGQTDLSVMQLILNLGLLSENALLGQVAELGCMRIVDAAAYPDSLLGLQHFNTRFVRQHQMVVLSESGDLLEICLHDPFLPGLQQALSFAIGNKRLVIRLGYKRDIQEALDRILMTKPGAVDNEKFDELDAVLLDQDIKQLKELASEAPVIKFVNTVVKEAILNNSSDIHIEPRAQRLNVRNRIDGVLINVREVPVQMAPAIVSRIKILANLDIAQRRTPQDGRMNMNVDGQDVDIRVSVIPTIHGESIVMRLLYKRSMNFDFDSLGYSQHNLQRINRMLDKPHGMILVTGPTGSGKSTSLYAMLQQINDSERKIVSVEDPVEYKVEGINQIQVNPEAGVSFSAALRAIVRHDPEVIMVGEMRDSETARIAIRASMTGHLILTTLHTNTAASSIERLIDLGAERAFVLSSLIGVVAQRLVRKLCDHCKKPLPSDLLSIHAETGEVTQTEYMGAYQAVGCDHCNHTGYRGRLSVCEVMTLNDEFRAQAQPGSVNLHQLALRHGMQAMVQDGFDKVKSGQTTIEELFRMILE
jgi:general secretion pathway protein E